MDCAKIPSPDDSGLACPNPKCRCRKVPVEYTRRRPSNAQGRVRKCSKCGTRFYCREHIVTIVKWGG